MANLQGLYAPKRLLPQPPTVYPALPTDPATLTAHGDVLLADALMTEAWQQYQAGRGSYPAWAERRTAHRDALAHLHTLVLRGL